MLAAGEFDLAQAELDSVTVPTNSPESIQLAGMLTLSRSLVAAADSRPGDAAASGDGCRTGRAQWLWRCGCATS